MIDARWSRRPVLDSPGGFGGKSIVSHSSQSRRSAGCIGVIVRSVIFWIRSRNVFEIRKTVLMKLTDIINDYKTFFITSYKIEIILRNDNLCYTWHWKIIATMIVVWVIWKLMKKIFLNLKMCNDKFKLCQYFSYNKKTYPTAPLAKTWVCLSRVSCIACGEYKLIGELNCLFTSLAFWVAMLIP